MSAEAADNSAVFYEQLENLEDEFEEVELELRKFHHCKQRRRENEANS